MFVRELNGGACKTYLIACEASGQAALIDPLREGVDHYLEAVAVQEFQLAYAIDTHTHADHRTGSFELRERTGVETVMHRAAPAPYVDIHVDDGGILDLGELQLNVLATPGHTPDGISLVCDGYVFTGDTLLIRGTGRADFAGGDPAAEYDSVTRKLFSLPDDTIVLPAHDYRGNTRSTIGEEKRLNPRLAGKSREEYVEIMNTLDLPLPDKIQEVLQANQAGMDDDAIAFPKLAQLNQVRQQEPVALAAMLAQDSPPLLLDVREPDEFRGPLGHIPGSLSVPLKTLPERAEEFAAWKPGHVVVICRAGVRSTTAAAILTGLGFAHVSNLKGGMLAWNDQGRAVQR